MTAPVTQGPWPNMRTLPGGYVFCFIEQQEDQHQLVHQALEGSTAGREQFLILEPPGHSQDLFSPFSTTAPPVAVQRLPVDTTRLEAILAALRASAGQAQAQGFSQLKAFIPADDLLAGCTGLPDLFQLLHSLDEFFRECRCTAYWLVHANRVSPQQLMQILLTQPRLWLSQAYYTNPFHLQADGLQAATGLAEALLHETVRVLSRLALEYPPSTQAFWLQRIFNSIYQFVSVLRPDGTLVEVNDPALAFAGLSRTEVIGRPFWDTYWWSLNPESGRQVKEAVQKAAAGEFIRYEATIRGKDDAVMAIDFSIQPVLDEQGKVILLIPEGRDISGLKRVEEKLSEREQLLQTMMAGAPVILFMVDRDGIIRLSEGKPLSFLRPLRGETLNRSIEDVYRDNPIVIDAVRRSMQGETVNAIVEINHLFFETRYSPLRDEQGEIQGVVGVATDVTETLIVKNAYHDSETRFRSIFQDSKIGMVVVGQDGRLWESNQAFQSLVGYSQDELFQMSIAEITHPLDRAEYTALFQSLIQGERENYHIEKRYVHKDGHTVWARLTGSLLTDRNGRPQAVIVVVEDITSQRQLEAELAEVQQRLMENREEERVQIARDLHDGPLQDSYTLLLGLQDLIDELDDPALREKATAIKTTVNNQMNEMRQLCNELRPPALAPFGLEKAIRSHSEQVQQSHSGLEYELNLYPDAQQLPEKIRLALYRIYQELNNNVIRHSQATRIKIDFSLHDRVAELVVEDNGQGFDIPTRWVELARQGHFGLLGIQERVEAVGGKLHITSRPGQGTLARVSVPIDQSNA
jgi:PAS domain S-box-containing protein